MLTEKQRKHGRRFVALVCVGVWLFVAVGSVWGWWLRREMSQIQSSGTLEGIEVTPVSVATVTVGQPPQTLRSTTWLDPFSGTGYVARTSLSTGTLVSFYKIADGGLLSLLFRVCQYVALFSLLFVTKCAISNVRSWIRRRN